MEPFALKLTGVQYRASSRMTPVSKRMIHDEIRKPLGPRREIETLVSGVRSPTFVLPSRQSRVVSMQDRVAVSDGWFDGLSARVED